METTFWTAVTIYYAALYGAITVQPAMIFVTFALFFTIPSLTQAEIMPGIRTSLNAQIEILETQRYLAKRGYYK